MLYFLNLFGERQGERTFLSHVIKIVLLKMYSVGHKASF